jgi:hypothetical protein
LILVFSDLGSQIPASIIPKKCKIKARTDKFDTEGRKER